MSTVADLWDTPEVKPKGGASDIPTKQKSFSTYKNGIEINEQAAPQQPQGSTIADLWESTPAATPAQLKQQSGSIVGDAIKTGFEMRKQLQGAGEVGLSALTGAVAAPLAAVTGVVAAARSGKFGTKEGVKAGEEQAANLMGQMTYQPRTEKGQEYIQGLQKAFEASKLPPVGVPETLGFAPLAGAATQQAMGAPGQLKAGFQKLKAELPTVRVERAGQPSAMQSGGAAARTNEAAVVSALESASPELQQSLKNVPVNQVNLPVLERHVEADSLPIPVRLTEGQATQDIHKISNEMNGRAKNPELANRLNEQNGQLIENLNAIRDNAAPNVFGTTHVENGQALINSYKEIDNQLKVGINEKYTALKDAAGGDFPVDGAAVANNTFKNLKKELKTDYLPTPIAKQLEAFKGGEQMTFEQFEALRTNLAAEVRKAERAGDGNTVAACNVARQALEDLPLTGAASELKPLADAARAAAKERFDLLGKDKAYKAAINGTVAADDFINKYVVNGKKADVDQMIQILGQDSTARETMAAGMVNWLKNKAGVINENGNFSQAGYNKALAQVDPKLLAIVGPDVEKQLKTLGNVARYTQVRPKGSYVNESNTFTAMMGEKAKSGAEQAVNLGSMKAGIPLPLGSMGRQFMANRAEAQQLKQSLQPGAGVQLKDIGKEK
jgi:hypothetical protein